MTDDQNEDFKGAPERNAADENPTAKQYGADHITVLEGIEAVRKRPAMYIGDTGVRCVSTKGCNLRKLPTAYSRS